MFSLTVKGNTLLELKNNLHEIADELTAVEVVGNDIQVSMPTTAMIGADPANSLANPVMEQLTSERVTALTSSTTISQADQLQPGNITPLVIPVNVELDVEGVPWDERIHTKARTKVSKGMWKLRRGVDETLVIQVKQELLGAVQQQANPPMVPAMPVTTNTPVVTPQYETPVTPLQIVQPVAPVTQAPVTPPAITGMGGGHTFQTFAANFPMIIGTLVSEGKLKQEYIETLKNHFQVEQIWETTDIQKNEIFETFVANNIIKKV